MTAPEPGEGLVEALQDRADAVLERFWREVLEEPRLADLAALVPNDRPLTIFDALPLAPLVMSHLQGPQAQLQVLDALAHAYARAAGLHFSEE